MRSIKKPDSGMAYVPSAMKNVNPHCTSESDQPVAVMNGLTSDSQYFSFSRIRTRSYRVVAISSGIAAPSARGSDAA